MERKFSLDIDESQITLESLARDIRELLKLIENKMPDIKNESGITIMTAMANTNSDLALAQLFHNSNLQPIFEKSTSSAKDGMKNLLDFLYTRSFHLFKTLPNPENN
ncbi:MAG: hypothetical protein K2Y22_04435 [Candidatus Obscuribacterales bacterium]|nr:hypothetical protein [Candidatus Obscuribacterales bacterium]